MRIGRSAVLVRQMISKVEQFVISKTKGTESLNLRDVKRLNVLLDGLPLEEITEQDKAFIERFEECLHLSLNSC